MDGGKELYNRYRPKRLKEIKGQPQITTLIRAYIDKGLLTGAFLAVGPSGVGKSSLASAICGELGISRDDYFLVPSQDCQVRDVEHLEYTMHLSEFGKSGYKFYLIDEAHTMTGKAINRWLLVLERIPAKRIVLFTSTKKTAFDLVWQSRCKVLEFLPLTEFVIAEVLRSVCLAEGDGVINCKLLANKVVNEYDGNMRTALQLLQDELILLKAGMSLDKPEEEE